MVRLLLIVTAGADHVRVLYINAHVCILELLRDDQNCLFRRGGN